jgi:tetratricopeptide (TPR) repeat protein
MVLLNQANLAWQQVRPIDEMIGLAEDAVAAFSKTGHRHWIALAYRVLGRNCRAGGLFGEAAGYFHQALAVGETLELHDLVASVRLSLGIHQIDQADFDRAESFLRQAAATAARCGQVETYRMSQYLIALSALIRGDLAGAERMLVPATMEQDRGIEQLPEILLSLLRRIQGLPTEAKRRLARMAGDGDTVEQYQVQVRSLLAATLADLDDPECHSWLDQARADAVRLKQARTSPFVDLCAGHVYLFEARQDPSGDGRDRAGAALDEARGLRGMAGDLALPTQILERALAHHDER